MGLSRNKVAVSEGAAGSPPFYGEREHMEVCSKNSNRFNRMRLRILKLVVQFSGTVKTIPNIWGCSSAGRAPALQAGGHGFESHHLHQEA